MTTGEKQKATSRGVSPRVAMVICGIVTVIVILADLATPANVMLPIIYGIPLVVCAWVRDFRFLWAMALFFVAMTFVKHYVGQPPSHAGLEMITLSNRFMSASVTLVLAGLIHSWITSDTNLECKQQILEKQNCELEAVNQELGQREEEIVRQNEELQSQTEELERQSEELRMTNEELANREKTLEHLLELSRSLNAELERDEMLKRICEALGLLTEGNASTILQKQKDDLVILCHHGFDPDGPEANSVPFDHSFTSLIMSRGQTGYVEDLSMRPDLRIPQPRNGEPLRSVLSSPLRVSGKCVGAIEIYSHDRHSWSDVQIAMIESLAAQASISLQGAELVETIRLERRRFEAAFRTVPFGMAVADDGEGRVLRFNPAAAAMFGVPPDENVALTTPIGARLLHYSRRDDQPMTEEQLPMTRALKGVEIQGEEQGVVFPTGKRLSLLVSAAPIYDGTGKIVGAVGGFVDILPLKSLQRDLDLRRREAEEASIRKTRFLAAVSHDLRTPANAINLLAEVIRRAATNTALAAEIPDLAKKLQANALSLVELVGDVLDVARFDSGKVEMQESEFVLGEAIDEECRHLMPLAHDKGLALEIDKPDRATWVRTDRVKLGRVIGNLVGNAIKFTEAGRITVKVSVMPDRQVILQIVDTGIGIAFEQQTRIFDEFAQLRNPERDRTKGTGLGLAICKRLVEVMGGTLSVESTPEMGSTFTVILPPACVVLRLDTTAIPRKPILNPEPLSTRQPELIGIHVLLVEDHASTRESTGKILEAEGAKVTQAADGKTALALLQQGNFDVLLLDMMLPDLDGREVLKSLKGERSAALKGVLVLTGDLTKERLEEVRQLGADGLMGKPIHVDKLVEFLRTVGKLDRKEE